MEEDRLCLTSKIGSIVDEGISLVSQVSPSLELVSKTSDGLELVSKIEVEEI